MKKVVIIQARMGSSRFPGKVLANLNGSPILRWVVNAAKSIPTADEVVVATTTAEQDQPIVSWCNDNNINVFQGNEPDVLERYYETAQAYKADIIVRITADCPLLDPNIAGQALYLVEDGLADYASNVLPATWPDGLDCEAFSFTALEYAHKNAIRKSDREHVTPFIRNNQHIFKVLNITSPIPGLQKYRWTIDTHEDLKFISSLISYCKKPITTYDLLSTLHANSQLIQPTDQRNEGFTKSLQSESVHCVEFKNSHLLLEGALKSIPLGAQTFSKSHIQYPENTSPMFLTHGCGSRVWDVDGNEYIDLVSGLLPNVLGYNDLDVNFAIQTQLEKGISFSLSTELEVKLAEKICSIIPCAQKIRFGKNGTDVTTAAIRLARAYTGRDKVITCGYHGWQDWYIGTTTRNKGVPKEVSALSTQVAYNDLNRLEELLRTEEYSAFILEPCNTTAPVAGYLQDAKSLCERYNTVLIFDEVITGFRFALGGAQEYFGVTPHLACFGKAMGNGMPISAVVGSDEVMREMDEIFFSGTFGGEALSLAASLATIKKIEDCNVIDKLWSYGKNLSSRLDIIINECGLEEAIKPCGFSPWRILQFLDVGGCSSWEIKTYFIQEMIRRGVLINSSFNINYAHTEVDGIKIIRALEETLFSLAGYLRDGSLSNHLLSPSIKPLFRVR